MSQVPPKRESAGEAKQPDLPLDLLNELDRNVNATKWTVPIKSDGALPVLLSHAVQLAKKGVRTGEYVFH